ncbi:MAG: heparan-alpha-glucosaminide N-acetyltransferase [Caldilineaceae bacterium]
MAQAATVPARKTKSSAARTSTSTRRLWEIDAWRGLAIVSMVIYHFAWDLRVYAEVYIDLFSPFWFYFQRSIASSFVLLVGISLTVSYNRARQKADGSDGLYWKFFRRGLLVLGTGLAMGTGLWLLGQGRIDFGVLHMIGVSIILAYPFLRFRWLNLLFIAILIPLSYYLQTIPTDTTAWVWLGITPPGYAPRDYFPLVHWFAVVLMGAFLGNSLYTGGVRQFSLRDYSAFFPFNLLGFLGKHSLIIYVIHQPILVGLFIVTGFADLGLF